MLQLGGGGGGEKRRGIINGCGCAIAYTLLLLFSERHYNRLFSWSKNY